MPELPEVQTVINYLKTKIINKKIIDLNILEPKMIKNVSEIDFKNTLINSSIINIDRIGKYLIFHLNNDFVMVSHLRMEGKYLIKEKNEIFNDKHIHLIFYLEDFNLGYHDTRKFGTFTIYKSSIFLESKELSKIAIDPLDLNFNSIYLYNKINKLKKNIKTILLDQSIVSGIGNIYCCEILFKSKISPFREGNSITKKECEMIVKSSKEILVLAIKHHGTTVSSFSFDNNHSGTFQKYLNVYNKNKCKCYNCNSIIIKDFINKRGTFYCSNCQK